MEKHDERAWEAEFRPAGRRKGIDLLSRDGVTAVKIERSPQGMRGVYSAAMRLALFAVQEPSLKRVCLVIDARRLSKERLMREWQDIKRLFSSEISNRLSLVALGREEWVEPEDHYLRHIAKLFEKSKPHARLPGAVIRRSPGQRYFEIVKVLLVRWLRRQGPIPVGELARQAGCTYPTIREAMKRLDERDCIKRQSNRSVELTRFPQRTWNEMVALSSSIRRPIRFVDASGDRADPHRLVRRLSDIRVSHIALSGVEAARFWQPDFDLHGTPRLDLVLHVPDDVVDLGFVAKLDPALKQSDQLDQSPVLVVHSLWRSESLFASGPPLDFPIADPVETALDLLELGLTEQAGQMLGHLRPEVRL